MEAAPQRHNKIRERTDIVSEKLGADISKVGDSESSLEDLSVRELRNRYPERYDVYNEIFTAIRHGRDIDAEIVEEKREWIQALNNLGEYIQKHHEGEATLRGRQANVFEDLHDFLEEGGKEGYVVLPTGVGKTVLFTEFIEAFGLRSMIVVPTQTLVRQTESKIEQFAPELEHGLVYEKSKDYGRQATIITYDSFVAGVRNGTINPKDYKVLILDEVHESLTPGRTEVVDAFMDSIKIGFTATPNYTESKSTENLLKTEIHRLEIREAIEEGLLAPLSCVLVRTKADMSSVQRRATGEYDDKEFEALLRAHSINKACVELYEKAFKGKRAIVFANSIAHSRELEREFAERSIFAACLDGDVKEDDQVEIIKAYKEGTVEVIIGVDMLTRGFDAPEAEVCLNVAPTTSLVRATQRGGRVLRLDENNPEKESIVVDFLYDDSRSGKPPLLFSSVVGEASVEPSYVRAGAPFRPRGTHSGERLNTSGLIIEGLEIITDVSEVMRITSEVESKNLTFPPEGWFNLAMLSKRLEVDRGTLERRIHTYENRNMFTDEMKLFRNKSGAPSVHYSPKLIELLTRELSAFDKAPAGWLNVPQLVKKLGIGRKSLQGILAPYEATEGSVGQFKSPGGGITNYYSPKVIERLLELTASFKDPPEGWSTSKTLSNEVGLSENRIKALASEYDHAKTDIGIFRSKSGQNATYFSPQFKEFLLSKKEELKLAPGGWLSAADIAAALGVARETAGKYLRRYESDANSMHIYPDPIQFQPTKFYAPDVLERLEKELNLPPKAPAGWVTNGTLAHQLGVGGKTVQSIAEKYGEDETYVRMYRGATKTTKHYSPELVEIIKQEIKTASKEAPAGWKTVNMLVRDLGVSSGKIIRHATKYENDDRYQREFRVKGVRTALFYSPELIKILEAEFSKNS